MYSQYLLPTLFLQIINLASFKKIKPKNYSNRFLIFIFHKHILHFKLQLINYQYENKNWNIYYS